MYININLGRGVQKNENWFGFSFKQQLQTITEDRSILMLPLSTHSAVEMSHDSVSK